MTDPTIATLLGLDDDDPWDRRSDAQKALATIQQRVRAAFETVVTPVQPFVDPPDSTDVTPRRGGYRIVVTGHKLSEVLAIEPGLLDVSVTARNSAVGCWVVLTSRTVAARLVAAFEARGVPARLEQVGADGQPATGKRTAAEYAAILDRLSQA